jgi:hypothetical protein
MQEINRVAPYCNVTMYNVISLADSRSQHAPKMLWNQQSWQVKVMAAAVLSGNTEYEHAHTARVSHKTSVWKDILKAVNSNILLYIVAGDGSWLWRYRGEVLQQQCRWQFAVSNARRHTVLSVLRACSGGGGEGIMDSPRGWKAKWAMLLSYVITETFVRHNIYAFCSQLTHVKPFAG